MRRRGKQFKCGCQATVRWDRQQALKVGEREFVIPHETCSGGVRVKLVGPRGVEFAGHVNDLKAAEAEANIFSTALARRETPPASIEELAERLGERKDREWFLAQDAALLEAILDAKKNFIRIGQILVRVKARIERGLFKTWMLLRGLEPATGYKLALVGQVFGDRANQTLISKHLISQEKAYILARLPEGTRREWIEQGVPVNGDGARQPLERTTFRQLRNAAAPILGATRRGQPRGRKPKPLPGLVVTPEVGMRPEIAEVLRPLLTGIVRLAGWKIAREEYAGALALYYQFREHWEHFQQQIDIARNAYDEQKDDMAYLFDDGKRRLPPAMRDPAWADQYIDG